MRLDSSAYFAVCPYCATEFTTQEVCAPCSAKLAALAMFQGWLQTLGKACVPGTLPDGKPYAANVEQLTELLWCYRITHRLRRMLPGLSEYAEVANTCQVFSAILAGVQ